MIFRYRIEYEFEAEHLGAAQEALNKGLVPMENMTLKTLEAVCSDDRIIPRKWTPKNRPSVVEFGDATQSGEEPPDDQLEHPGDDPLRASPKPSNSRLDEKSGKIEEKEDIPF